MTIGLLRIEFIIPAIGSLKEKRSLIRKLKNRVRNDFNVSVAEIGNLNNFGKGMIGFTTLSKDGNVPQKVLNRVEEYIDKHFNIIVTDRLIETF
ncbi:MAG: DUF503 domain-containing protein [Candidatus Marinimicrobia bacterium]|nr:DUF503 domain-containing protein [Candidatus Neomarinimicrobiota bacterium]